MNTSEEQRNAFCELTVIADSSCTEIISLAHSLYYYCDDLSPRKLAYVIKDLREAFDKLGVAIQCAEEQMGVRQRVASASSIMQQLRDAQRRMDDDNDQLRYEHETRGVAS